MKMTAHRAIYGLASTMTSRSGGRRFVILTFRCWMDRTVLRYPNVLLFLLDLESITLLLPKLGNPYKVQML